CHMNNVDHGIAELESEDTSMLVDE
ncbi:unnamed protein product, partial [Rotaria magnacalcarata]